MQYSSYYLSLSRQYSTISYSTLLLQALQAQYKRRLYKEYFINFIRLIYIKLLTRYKSYCYIKLGLEQYQAEYYLRAVQQSLSLFILAVQHYSLQYFATAGLRIRLKRVLHKRYQFSFIVLLNIKLQTKYLFCCCIELKIEQL